MHSHPMSTSIQAFASRNAGHGWHNVEAEQALDLSLNAAILHIASKLFPCGFDVADNAPETYEKLCAHLDSGARMVVWSGASDQTIFGDPEVNYAFRAWHDFHHWRGKLPFTPEGERAACERQIADLFKLYGDSPQTRRWADIIRAEVIGQAEYCQMHGDFPADQMAFVRAYLIDTYHSIHAVY